MIWLLVKLQSYLSNTFSVTLNPPTPHYEHMQLQLNKAELSFL